MLLGKRNSLFFLFVKEGRGGLRAAVGQAGLVRRRDVWLREGTAMGEANFLFAGNEHVQGPAEGLSSAGAPGQPALAAHPLAAARGHHNQSRPPCTCRRADSSSHPTCLRRALSGEFLGSKSNGLDVVARLVEDAARAADLLRACGCGALMHAPHRAVTLSLSLRFCACCRGEQAALAKCHSRARHFAGVFTFPYKST